MNGEVLSTTGPSTLPLQYHPRRVRRTRLQSALISRVPPGIIQLNKRLTALENIEEGGVRLTFEDGTETTADLVIGADGIRSVYLPNSQRKANYLTSFQVVRESIFPEHNIKFIGSFYLFLLGCL